GMRKLRAPWRVSAFRTSVEGRMMKGRARTRFWIEATLATLTATLFVLSLAWPDWIEAVSGVDPDQHSGLVEWAVVGVLLVGTVVGAVLARAEWRRLTLTADA